MQLHRFKFQDGDRLLVFISAFSLWKLSLKHITFKHLDEVNIQNLKINYGKKFLPSLASQKITHLISTTTLKINSINS